MSPAGWTAVIVSPLIGSFLACAAVRLSKEESLGGRSACRSCGRVLSVRDLVPILSWLVLRGRCRSCGARISPAYPLIEVLAWSVALQAALMVGDEQLPQTLALGWVLLLLSAIDLRCGRLPDILTLPLAVGGIAVAGNVPEHALGAIAGWGSFAILAALYRWRRGTVGLGGGDAKLMGAIGAWLGPSHLPMVVLVAAVFGLVFVGVTMFRDGWAGERRLAFGPFLSFSAWFLDFWVWE